jgi:23S rRNA pseudouridine955/2504/2580 synthase
VTVGVPKPASGVLIGYISKDDKSNTMKVTQNKVPDSKYAETKYKTLATSETESQSPLSLLECQLITGRKHQIRVQMQNFGYPILGDSKYGNRRINESLGEAHQLLCSYKVSFSFEAEADILSYLNGKSFELKNITFTNKYFEKT